MGVDTATAMATIRLSVGRFTTADEVDEAGLVLPNLGLTAGMTLLL